MYALRMVGLVVLAGLCVTAFIIGYDYFQEFSKDTKAEQEASRLDQEITEVINSLSIENETSTIDIPSNYTLKFEDNRLIMNGYKYPKNEPYGMSVKGPTLESGEHKLLISMENESVIVSEVG